MEGIAWATQKNTRLVQGGLKMAKKFLAFAESASASLFSHFVMSEL